MCACVLGLGYWRENIIRERESRVWTCVCVCDVCDLVFVLLQSILLQTRDGTDYCVYCSEVVEGKLVSRVVCV